MMAIEYLDLAEQCLLALEKLSRLQPEACLGAGVIMAVLGFIDFFELSNQRTAVSTASNVCRHIPQKYLPNIMEALPTLTNLLDFNDQRIVEYAAISFIGITDSFGHSSDLLDALCSRNRVVQKLVLWISPDSQIKLSEETRTGLLRMLIKIATNSLVVVRTLFEVNVGSILGSILNSYDQCTPSPLSNSKSCNQVELILKLCNQLIPPVAKGDQDVQLILQKEKIIMDHPMFLNQIATSVLPASIQMVNSGANTYVTYGCLSIIENITCFMATDKLSEVLLKENMPRFLAGVLSRKDPHILFSTLKIVESLMKKFHGVLLDPFFKEGVIHGIHILSEVVDFTQLPANQTEVENGVAAKCTSNCLCYAFGDSFPSTTEGKKCMLQNSTIHSLAKSIKSTFFTSVSSERCSSGTLQKVKSFCTELETNRNSSAADWDHWVKEEERLSHILDQVMKEVKRKETMSNFEFLESGIVRAFAHYLSNGEYLQRILDKHDTSDVYRVVAKRLQTFTSLLFTGQSLEDLPLTSLIKYLQNALSALDRFPVILSSPRKTQSRHTHIPAKQLTDHPCLQVRFVKEGDDSDISNYDNVLTVDCSSSFDAIEEVLWSKVHKKTNKFQSLAKGFLNQRQKTDTANNGKELAEQDESTLLESEEDGMTSKLTFILDGKQVDRSISLYQAILREKFNADPDITVTRAFWDEVHTVTFRKEKELKTCSLQTPLGTLDSSSPWSNIGLSWQNASFFSTLLLAELPCTLSKSTSSYDILFLLKILEGLNQSSYQVLSSERSNAFAEGRIKSFDDLKVRVLSVAQTEFISSKLTSKLVRQMKDPLAVSSATLPSWCKHLMEVCPFLFSFEARSKYFYLDVAVLPENVKLSEERQLSKVLPRKKLTVDRSNILVSAAKMVSWRGDKKVLLEVEYSGEVGTGLGPTLEFFTLVSHEFQKCGLGMWRGDQTSPNFVAAPHGLFLRPWSKSTRSSNGVKFSRVLKNFSLLGHLIARAIQDGRIIDLPFSKAFYKLMLDKELDVYDILSFDPELGTSLVEFQALVNRKKFLESRSGEDSNDSISALSFRNTRIEDLCLCFGLPGYPEYKFSSKRKSHMVHINNLESYVSLVVDATVRTGISRQFEAFKTGFNKVFPLRALHIFTEEELERILCGEQSAWNLNELVDHINFDHGYSSTCSSAINFVEIIQEFDYQKRRSFLQFLTGSPRLPPGGFAALKPKLTVVRKHCSANVDQELPSVMTCANYLKLPPYTSKGIMREKLLYAISEGQGSFHLS